MKANCKNSLLSISFLRSCTRKEVFKYIRKLHRLVKRQQRKLQQYKHKVKFLSHVKPTKHLDSEGELCEETKKEEPKSKTLLEEITEAAEAAQNKTDFVYEPTSGLYYDQRTGYYYNAEYGLYYDGTTGCYYRYNQDKNEFEFHSQVQTQSGKTAKVSNNYFLYYLVEKFSKLNIKQLRVNALGKFLSFSWSENTYFFKFQEENVCVQRSQNDEKIKNGNSKRKRKKRMKFTEDLKTVNAKKEEIEDGEISSSSESDYNDTEIIISDSNSCEVQSKYEDVAKKYPPSLRIIVQETNLPKLKIGTLFLITFKGGSLGREGDHEVIIPDVNVSKFHLKFTYDESESVYKCIDLGSRNGTFLNGKRMSNAKQESDALNLVHGSILVLSQTKLLCHIHSGNSTCGHCEPGLIIDQQSTDKVVTLSHKAQLKVLQKRYGLENEKYINPGKTKSDPNYADRAADRRDKVGSTNEYEKTEIASLETAISSKNKGFEMLSKLGWNKGESLGKGQGLLEPIKLVNNEGTTGLGCDKPNVSISFLRKDQRKLHSLAKTRQRYNQLKSANVFLDSDDSSSD